MISTLNDVKLISLSSGEIFQSYDGILIGFLNDAISPLSDEKAYGGICSWTLNDETFRMDNHDAQPH